MSFVASNVKQTGHIIIECCSNLLVWQRRKNIFVFLQQFRRFYSLSSITLALTKPVFYFGRRRWNPRPLILQANRSTVLPRCFPLEIYISFAPSTDQRASLHAGQQAMQSVINRSTPASCGCLAVVSRISGVRRGRIQVLTLFELSAEHIPHLCQQDCLCNRLNSQRASTSLLIKRNNRYTWKIMLETRLSKQIHIFHSSKPRPFMPKCPTLSSVPRWPIWPIWLT